MKILTVLVSMAMVLSGCSTVRHNSTVPSTSGIKKEIIGARYSLASIKGKVADATVTTDDTKTHVEHALRLVEKRPKTESTEEITTDLNQAKDQIEETKKSLEDVKKTADIAAGQLADAEKENDNLQTQINQVVKERDDSVIEEKKAIDKQKVTEVKLTQTQHERDVFIKILAIVLALKAYRMLQPITDGLKFLYPPWTTYLAPIAIGAGLYAGSFYATRIIVHWLSFIIP
jgi:uncharacterized protein YceK